MSREVCLLERMSIAAHVVEAHVYCSTCLLEAGHRQRPPVATGAKALLKTNGKALLKTNHSDTSCCRHPHTHTLPAATERGDWQGQRLSCLVARVSCVWCASQALAG